MLNIVLAVSTVSLGIMYARANKARKQAHKDFTAVAYELANTANEVARLQRMVTEARAQRNEAYGMVMTITPEKPKTPKKRTRGKRK